MMESVLIGITGLCLGVLDSDLRVPRVRWVPLVCSLILTALAAVAIIELGGGSLANGLIFVFSSFLAASVHGAWLWKRNGLDRVFSNWQLIGMSAYRPSYLRAVYRQFEEIVDVDLAKSASQ